MIKINKILMLILIMLVNNRKIKDNIKIKDNYYYNKNKVLRI
jgi:hypothetical protein